MHPTFSNSRLRIPKGIAVCHKSYILGRSRDLFQRLVWLNLQSALLVLLCTLISELVVLLIFTSNLKVEGLKIAVQTKYIMVHQVLTDS